MTNKKIFIFGGARSGLAAAKVLTENNSIVITDAKDFKEEEIQFFKKNNIEYYVTNTPENLIDNSFDIMVKNPGIHQKHKAIIKAKELDIEVINEMEVGFRLLKTKPFIIGVTGSNGKTTTVTLIYEMLKKLGLDVVLGGNIGYPFCDILEKINKESILLLEISDHQLLDFKEFKTNISLLTNVCPTHLDFHDGYDAYLSTKKKIFNHHTKKDIAFINHSNEDSFKVTNDIDSTKIYFNNEINYINEIGIFVNNELIIKLEDIKLKGIHNYENILAALMVLNEIKLDKEIVTQFLKNFNGVEHRVEFIKTINGVSYYNDSKATNPTSVITALKTFNKPIHLILGGLERTQNYEEILPFSKNVKCIYAIGEVTDRVCELAKKNNIKSIKSVTVKQAVLDIQQNLSNDEIVLLSPGSASWDQYPKFEDRGDDFKKCVNSI